MKISYRPEIDGLRAIAVGVVILYHSKISLFGHRDFDGGFIWVDIFFVISGYLISSIILKELLSKGSLDLKYFYERRVRRILPLLLIIMMTSILFAWLFLLPSSFEDFSKSILYTLVLVQTFSFIFLVKTIIHPVDCLNLFFILGHYQLKNNSTLYFQ